MASEMGSLFRALPAMDTVLAAAVEADALLAEYAPLADKLYAKLAHQLREE